MAAETEVLDAEFEEIVDGEGGKALAVHRGGPAGLIRPVAAPSEVLAVQEQTRQLIQQTLHDGRDFGVIPGTKKPTLYKAGAERINAAFGCVARYKIVEKEIDHDRPVEWTKRTWKWGQVRGEKVWTEETGVAHGLYRYVLVCELVHRESGVVIGEGVGSCSTMEAKYIDRPRDLENTVLKMAKKRAYVDATLTTFGLSEQFTQDVEDMDLGASNGHDNNGHTNGNGTAPNTPFSLTDKVGFGKYKDSEWGFIVKNDPDYVSWAIQNANRLTDEGRKALAEAIEDHDAKYGAGGATAGSAAS